MILACLSLMAKDVEYHLMCFFDISISLWMKCLMSFAQFSNWIVFFFMLSFESFLCILDISLLYKLVFKIVINKFRTEI